MSKTIECECVCVCLCACVCVCVCLFMCVCFACVCVCGEREREREREGKKQVTKVVTSFQPNTYLSIFTSHNANYSGRSSNIIANISPLTCPYEPFSALTIIHFTYRSVIIALFTAKVGSS